MFAPAPDHPAEWEVLLRLGVIARGQGAQADVAKFDDELLMEELRKQAGEQAPLVFQALAGRRGPKGCLDLALVRRAARRLFLAPARRPELRGQGGGGAGRCTTRRTAAAHPRAAPPAAASRTGAALLADRPRALVDLNAPAPALVLIGCRDAQQQQPDVTTCSTLAIRSDRCTALVNQQDAARLGLADGARARLAANGAT